MFTITLLLITLAILSPIVSSSIEPRRWGHQIDYGVLTSDYVDGFVGERPWTGPDGDYLRATFCYCKTMDDGVTDLRPRLLDSWGNRDGQRSGGGGGIHPGEVVQGHFWRYEYYNYHNNATYFLNHYCMEDAFPIDKFGCGYDAPGKFNPSPDSYWDTVGSSNDWSFVYSPIPGHAKHTWTVYKKETDVDWIAYGRGEFLKNQKRRLGFDQGLIQMPRDWVEETCHHYCDTELRLPMDHTVWSHGELYNDIDDMCDRCA